MNIYYNEDINDLLKYFGIGEIFYVDDVCYIKISDDRAAVILDIESGTKH